jgi:hypothetical protein
MSGNFIVERNKTDEYRDIPTLWIGVRNGRKAFQIEWQGDGPRWFVAGPLTCHRYVTGEWRLILHGKLLGSRCYGTYQEAMRAAQRMA